ncbi:unnamed protein product [Phyllotreta striolata]|uniref:Palmitoyltransferase n=1 Tax=Phyllotreta striolata TaxID=444603 RepID=A0A9N9XW75_PHYSR|nr:unnamed protein product [Phyllotreta striolata]
MAFRRNILPKCVEDALATGLLVLMIPTCFYFQFFVVVPTYHEQWGTGYNLNLIASTVLLFGVCANFLALILTDTSVKKLPARSRAHSDWRYCTECKEFAPPRSWHCKICDVCILQRDHHCLFTSCCVGFDNQRYYLVLLFYMLLSQLYGAYYSFYFSKDFLIDWSWYSIVKFAFPVFFLFTHFDVNQIYILIINLMLSGMVGTAILFQYHVELMLKSFVTYERKTTKSASKYDRGRLKNVEIVLGSRWYLVWIAPWIKSPPPCDGTNWELLEAIKGA